MEQQAEAEHAIIKANADAEMSKIKAEADLEVSKKQADTKEYKGLKEAAANEAIAKSVTQELINYNYSIKWDGKLPTMVAGDSMIPVVNDINK